MSFFKNLFGRKKKQPESLDNIQLQWINAEDTPWNIRVLDLRSLTQDVITTSQNEQMAINAVSYGGEDGTSFYHSKPEDNTTIHINLVLNTDKKLQPGVMFTPDTMEHKWAIFYDGINLIFVRSWLRQVFFTAKTSQKENELIIESITGGFSDNESDDFKKAFINFLLISHCTPEHVPAPLPKHFEADHKSAGYWAFSAYGNKVHFSTFDETFIPKNTKPLRSHSLLHIAVAKGDLEEIDRQLANGADINALAGDGLAPLHWSIVSETIASLQKLIDLHADVNVRSIQGATPIMNAVQSDKQDKLEFLVKHGASVNAKDNRGFTALHRAAEMGRIEMVKYLLEHGADRSTEAEGHTAMSLAKLQCNNDIIALLEK